VNRSSRPQDTPLSNQGQAQATRLGKWLRKQGNEGEFAGFKSAKIFASPFVRTLQTADCVARALKLGINIEPGVAEDPSYMALNGKPQKPWMLNIYDLCSVSLRINLEYKPFQPKLNWKNPPAVQLDAEGKVVKQNGSSSHGLTGDRNTDGAEWMMRPTEDDTEARCRTMIRTITESMPDDSVTFVVTHACPASYMVKELNPAPGGIVIPDYKSIKKQNYNGPPLLYSACTRLDSTDGGKTWDLPEKAYLFGCEHDPDLSEQYHHSVIRASEVAGTSNFQDMFAT